MLPPLTADALLPPTAVERAWRALAPPEHTSSAEALYRLMPRQRGGQLPLVDVPYDPRSEEHWAEAARIADYVAHLPAAGEGRGRPQVLDIGPGDGWPALPVAAARPDADIVGVDPAAERCRVSAENARRLGLPNARFLRGDAARLPFPDAHFDLVTAASALEEAADPPAVFAELRRVLRPGGALRASYQDWTIDAAGWESVLAWDGVERGGERVLLYSYVRRSADPPLERRYTLVLPDRPPAAALHAELLLAIAEAPRAYGETLLRPPLGVPAVERLAPHALGSTVVELRRWTTEWLATALRGAGFATVETTVHPGELGRRFARDLAATGEIEAFVPLFGRVTAALGGIARDLPGRQMITAVR